MFLAHRMVVRRGGQLQTGTGISKPLGLIGVCPVTWAAAVECILIFNKKRIDDG